MITAEELLKASIPRVYAMDIKTRKPATHCIEPGCHELRHRKPSGKIFTRCKRHYSEFMKPIWAAEKLKRKERARK